MSHQKTTRPFLVNVARLRGRPGEREEIDIAGPLEELSTSGAAVAADFPVLFRGTIEAIEGGRIVVAGSTQATWHGDCRRCLKDATGDVDAALRETFEDDATEGDTYPFDGDSADLEPMIREAIMLEIPIAPLCKQDCAGLCAECGADRNETSCNCQTDTADPRWSVLDALKDD